MSETDVLDGWVQARAAERVAFNQGFLLVNRNAAVFSGYSGGVVVKVGAQCNIDLHTRFAADVQLVLQGKVDEHRVSLVADVVCLTHITRDLTLRLHPGCGVRELCFADGAVVLEGVLRRTPTCETSPALNTRMEVIRSAKLVGKSAVSTARLALVLPGVLMEVSSEDGIDTVFGTDPLVPALLDGKFADFNCSLNGRVISLERRGAASRQVVHVLGKGGLSFSDGRSSADALRGFLRGGPQIEDQNSQVNTMRVVAVAVSRIPHRDWSNATFGDLLEHVRDDELFEGRIIEAEVTFSKPILVVGTPRIELSFGPIRRLATYVAGSGSATLRFAYTVDAKDVQALEHTRPDGASVLEMSSHDIEVGHLVADGAVLLEALDKHGENGAGSVATRLHAIVPAGLERATSEDLDIDLSELEGDANATHERRSFLSIGTEFARNYLGATQGRKSGSFDSSPSGFAAPHVLTFRARTNSY